jgi:hypothetical protein
MEYLLNQFELDIAWLQDFKNSIIVSISLSLSHLNLIFSRPNGLQIRDRNRSILLSVKENDFFLRSLNYERRSDFEARFVSFLLFLPQKYNLLRKNFEIFKLSKKLNRMPWHVIFER